MYVATLNMELDVSCNNGYTTSGTSVCQPDGTWNPEPGCYGN